MLGEENPSIQAASKGLTTVLRHQWLQWRGEKRKHLGFGEPYYLRHWQWLMGGKGRHWDWQTGGICGSGSCSKEKREKWRRTSAYCYKNGSQVMSCFQKASKCRLPPSQISFWSESSVFPRILFISASLIIVLIWSQTCWNYNNQFQSRLLPEAWHLPHEITQGFLWILVIQNLEQQINFGIYVYWPVFIYIITWIY